MRKILNLLLIILLVFLSACTDDSQVSVDQPVVEASQAVPQTISAADLAAKEAKKVNKYAWSADGNYTGRTRIVDGQLVEWGEEYPMDKNNKPIRYEATANGNGTPIHSIYYNVNGEELEVVVNEKDGHREFYEEGKTNNFAQIGEGVDKSNEAVLRSVAANRKLNEEIEKYR